MPQARDVASASREEFRSLFDAHYDYLYCSLRRLGVQERDLEDVAHDVFIEVYAKLRLYDRARPFRPWLFAFAVRFASDYRKLARHKTDLRSEPEVASTIASSAPSVEEVLGERDSARLLHAALDELSIALRAVIVLYEIGEVPMKEITEALSIPLHTGYSRLRLARAQCAEAVKRLSAASTRREGGAR